MAAKPDKKRVLSSNEQRGRGRAPLVSVLVALSLVASCAILISVRYGWGFGDAENGNANQEQQSTASPPEATDETPQRQEETPTPTISIEPPPPKTPAVTVRGIYVGARFADDEERISDYIELCGEDVINSLIIDVKEDGGQITFLNNNESLSATSYNIIPNIEQLVSRMKEEGIYTIARLVCFKDPIWSRLNPEHALVDSNGNIWEDGGRSAWLDPYDTAAWEYLAEAAIEAARVGFDEIQLDYVRFPSDGRIDQIVYSSASSGKTKAEVICEFLEYMREALADTPIWLSADVFGIISVGRGDFENIGQDLELLLQNADYVCPMIYPSHFANKMENGVGQIINGILFEIPDLEPYEVVYNILRLYKNRLPEEDGDAAIIRPYLQAFTAPWLGSGYFQTYTAQEVYEQIRAVYDAGFDEWILWNPFGDPNLYRNVSSLISSENSAGSSS